MASFVSISTGMQPVWNPDSLTLDLDRAIHYTLFWGLEGLVLREVGNPGEIIPNVNEHRLTEKTNEENLPVVAVDPCLFEGPSSDRARWMNELLLVEEVVAFCKRVRCPAIIVGSLSPRSESLSMSGSVEVLRQAATQAEKHNIHLLLSNDSSTFCDSGRQLSQLLTEINHPSVCAFWRPVESAKCGEDPDEGLSALLDAGCKVGLVEASNTNQSEAEQRWYPSTLLSGVVDWNRQFEQLAESKYDGPVMLSVQAEPKAKTGLADAGAMISLIRKYTR